VPLGRFLEPSRCGKEPSRIIIDEEDAERLGVSVRKDRKSGETFVSNSIWREVLGHWMFGLPLNLKGSAYEESFTPTFRSMLSYFIRRRGAGAFLSPQKQAEQQKTWDRQVNLSYLLGLDWTVPFDLQRVRENERQLDELKKAAKGGAIGDVIGTVAELRPKVVLAEARAEKLRTALVSCHA
jgi:uncharacterized protein YydD (DUF2326 family)